MFAEAVHSVADTATEALLLTALRRSSRGADRLHPFGYGKERFFWALIAAVSIFVSGAVVAAFEGIRTVLSDEEDQTLACVAYAVLALSFVIEGTSWLPAVREVRAESRHDGVTPLQFLRTTDDPTVKSVFFEDSATLIGLLLVFAGVGLHQLTGSAFWDGLASVLIAVLLTGVAYVLGGTNKGLLIGRQANRRTVLALRDALAERPEVEQVVNILTMVVGTGQILLCARLDFVDALDAAALERACAQLDADLRARFPDLQEIFVEPVPRTDPAIRQRLLARYGPAAAQRLETGCAPLRASPEPHVMPCVRRRRVADPRVRHRDGHGQPRCACVPGGLGQRRRPSRDHGSEDGDEERRGPSVANGRRWAKVPRMVSSKQRTSSDQRLAGGAPWQPWT
jgi:cation diffusion facilitator family transporter